MAISSSAHDEAGSGPAIGPSLLRNAFFVVCAFVPAIAFFQSKGIVPAVIGAVLLGLLERKGDVRILGKLPKSVTFVLIGIVAWTGITSFWADDVAGALIGTAKLGSILVVGGLLMAIVQTMPPRHRARLADYLTIGWCAALALLLVEIVFDGPIFGGLLGAKYDIYRKTGVGYFWLNGCATVLLLSAWPVVGVFKRRFNTVVAIGVFAVLLYVLVAIQFWAAVLAACVGWVSAALVSAFRKQTLVAMAAIIVLYGFLFPIAAQHHDLLTTITRDADVPIRESGHRLAIWAFTSDRIAEHPWSGWGMNASKTIPGGNETLYSDSGAVLGPALPLHPHNTVLQIWLELGIVGVILFMGLIAAVIRHIYSSISDRYLSAVAAAQLAAVFIFANISFGIWQVWWITTLWFGAVMILTVSAVPARNAGP